MNYALIDAARQFKRLLREASDEDLNDTYQRLATETNSSDHANSHEPLAGLTAAVQAEINRRDLETREESGYSDFDEQEPPEPEEPFTNDDRVFGPEEI